MLAWAPTWWALVRPKLLPLHRELTSLVYLNIFFLVTLLSCYHVLGSVIGAEKMWHWITCLRSGSLFRDVCCCQDRCPLDVVVGPEVRCPLGDWSIDHTPWGFTSVVFTLLEAAELGDIWVLMGSLGARDKYFAFDGRMGGVNGWVLGDSVEKLMYKWGFLAYFLRPELLAGRRAWGGEEGDVHSSICTHILWTHTTGIDHTISAVVCILLCAWEQLWHFQAFLVASDGWPHVSALTCGRPEWGQTSDGSAWRWYFGRKVQIIFQDNILPPGPYSTSHL